MSVPLPYPTTALDAQDVLTLFTMLIWGEARGLSQQGKLGVACVVRNRVHMSPRFGDGFRGVMLKPKQFSCFNPSDPNYPKVFRPADHAPSGIWHQCGAVAEAVFRDEQSDITGGALWYHTVAQPKGTTVWPPTWTRTLRRVCRIDAHLFWGEP